jgi:ribokinase
VIEATRRILVAGSINTDLVVRVKRAPEAGETVTGSAFAMFGGGKGANQAIAAARSGALVMMLGAVGDDDFGRQRLRDLTVEGIDVGGVVTTSAAASGVALIIVDASGQNRIAYVPGATGTISSTQASSALRRADARVLLTTLELPGAALIDLYREARAAGAVIVNNATPEPSLGRDIAAIADVIVVNETEALELLGREDRRPDWRVIAAELRHLGPRIAVITLGAAGAVVDVDGEFHQLPAPTVQVVDSTGAGDAFCGAFAARLASGAGIVEAARAGVAAGSIAVTRAGAQPSMPRSDEIDRMLQTMSEDA